MALLQKEKAPLELFVVDEFRREHGCEEKIVGIDNDGHIALSRYTKRDYNAYQCIPPICNHG